MKIIFKNQFTRQLEKLKDQKLKSEIYSAILRVEAAKDILKIQNIKKLKGHRFFYRIRIGQYRVGLKIEKGTVSFAAFDHRKDIYKYFP